MSTLVENNPLGKAVQLFDKNGKSLSISSAELRLPGELQEETLKIGDVTIALSPEYRERLLRRQRDVTACLLAEKFSKTPVSGGFSLNLDVENAHEDYVVLRFGESRFLLNRRTNLTAGERIRLYYKTEDLVLYAGEERLTAHYPIRRKAKVQLLHAGTLQIFGKPFKTGRPLPAGLQSVEITKDAFYLSYEKGKNAIAVGGCLEEEFINGEKLMHLALPHTDGYVSVMTDERITCFGKKKVWLHVIPDKIKILDIASASWTPA